ncbi:MAG TPA: glycine cleavage T C-terminal barrel domain-containing protein [Solirubrobacterales bacterium]|nr:glycine cleavage T C-terminal barrel domain-containing protein [Solirubrobacterales bacterium]
MPSTVPEVELDGQYRALREEAGYLPRERACLLVRGADAPEYLQGQLTNEIEALPPGRGCYAALLDRKGHIQADMRVLRLDQGRDRPSSAPERAGSIWLDLEPGAAPETLKHLRTYSIGREVEVEDVSERWAITSLIGPRAAELAGVDGLGPEYGQRFREADGIEMLAVATDLGVDAITRPEQAESLRRRLADAGAAAVSEDAAEIVRVESGRPRFGLDMDRGLMPAEAGITDRAVSFEKGCYIGQEPVARLHYRGKPNRRLRGLRLSATAERGDPLRLGDREVGEIGTAVLSPSLGPIALAVIRREAEEGDQLSVGDMVATAEVVELPFAA